MAPTPADPERDPVRAIQRAVAPALTMRRRDGEKKESRAVPAKRATVKMMRDIDSLWAASALEREKMGSEHQLLLPFSSSLPTSLRSLSSSFLFSLPRCFCPFLPIPLLLHYFSLPFISLLPFLFTRSSGPTHSESPPASWV